MTEQEKADITLVSWGEEGENMFSSLPWERRTEAVSLRAVETWAGNLKYVPEDVLTEEICLAAVRKDGELLDRSLSGPGGYAWLPSTTTDGHWSRFPKG